MSGSVDVGRLSPEDPTRYRRRRSIAPVAEPSALNAEVAIAEVAIAEVAIALSETDPSPQARRQPRARRGSVARNRRVSITADELPMSLDEIIAAEKERENKKRTEAAAAFGGKSPSRAAVAVRNRRASRAAQMSNAGMSGTSRMTLNGNGSSDAQGMSNLGPALSSAGMVLAPGILLRDTHGTPLSMLTSLNAEVGPANQMHQTRGRVRKNSMSVAADMAASVFEAQSKTTEEVTDRMVSSIPPPPTPPVPLQFPLSQTRRYKCPATI
jgi:hypothetical protein